MWIVLLALRRPYTFIVLALLLPLLGALTLLGTPLRAGMPTDIFPDIRIPVIAMSFNYSGMSPDEMAGRITAQIERYATTIINDIEHVESQTYPGATVIKLFFQPGVDINLAMAQATAFGQISLKQMPPGTQPPLILKYSASSVPIIQLAMSSDRLTESQLFDFGNHHGLWRLDPVPVRRRDPSGPGRSEARGAAGAGVVGERCQHRDLQSKPHRAGRYRENRQHRVQREAQRQHAEDR
jgi:multidrug efflux pump subunit AcrB